MWVLEAIDSPEPQSQPLCYYLPAGIFSVGRVTGGVSDILCNHQSISRKHAEISVTPLKAGQQGLPDLTLIGEIDCTFSPCDRHCMLATSRVLATLVQIAVSMEHW